MPRYPSCEMRVVQAYGDAVHFDYIDRGSIEYGWLLCQIKKIAKDNGGEKGQRLLKKLTHKDFATGFRNWKRDRYRNPDRKYALIYAVNALKKRLRIEEDSMVTAEKEDNAREEKKMDTTLAKKISDGCMDEFQQRDKWWNGLSIDEKNMWRVHKENPYITYYYYPEYSLMAWAWEEHKKEQSNGNKED